ncbi:endonuclease/exonuclease/phosphatase family protein [Coraliomargarita akajimensis]|uniref:Endonuclease/exonuclease/phosphatase n=1 Tax=Coraliomargarita akajimensis (strain DSM 45221 / IAM 15411 / JCM 23193 / KCTC 12865 / 04OKA010-24) TaxID=583355 RepID=D5EJS5_CORAD|nr:endonuclease/exonuclease/phosphatase family protein [Coraliomargarita akajimensis]ADE54674.1 Endonuclease/exonuclease/phosphatase [Coraliomargarita akajimensis DSM 45221]
MPGRALRFLTLNIAHGRGLSLYQGLHRASTIERNLQRIVRLLEREQPDVVAMQEVDGSSHWNKHINLLEFLAREAGYAYHHLGVHNRRLGKLPLAYGNALLSRYPIENPDTQAFGSAELGEKGFLYSELRLPAGHLPVVNLHLDFRSRQRRLDQVERLIGYLEARHREKGGETYFSPIICGDFNSSATKQRDAVKHLIGYLEGHCAYQLLPSGGKTFPSILPMQSLDFIFVPPSHEVRRCEVLKSYVSDHRPVVADLELFA